jgi:hypothetical protein
MQNILRIFLCLLASYVRLSHLKKIFIISLGFNCDIMLLLLLLLLLCIGTFYKGAVRYTFQRNVLRSFLRLKL